MSVGYNWIRHPNLTFSHHQWLARVCLDGPRQDWHVGYNKYQGYYETNFKMKGTEKKIFIRQERLLKLINSVKNGKLKHECHLEFRNSLAETFT